MSARPITATGQLIPLVVGAYVLFITILAVLKDPFLQLVQWVSKLISRPRTHAQNGNADIEPGPAIEGLALQEGVGNDSAREEHGRVGNGRSQEEEDPLTLLRGATKGAEEEPQGRHRSARQRQAL